MSQFRTADKWGRLWWRECQRRWGVEARVSVSRGAGEAEGGRGWEEETDPEFEGKTLADE